MRLQEYLKPAVNRQPGYRRGARRAINPTNTARNLNIFEIFSFINIVRLARIYIMTFKIDPTPNQNCDYKFLVYH
jgi:hypothetical protein